MYLVIHKAGQKQIPIKLYEDAKQAYDFIENYIAESDKRWSRCEWFVDEKNNKSITKQRWYTYQENGTREEIGIRYMKLIKKEE